ARGAAPGPRRARAVGGVGADEEGDVVGRSGAAARERPGEDGAAHVHERERLDRVDRLAPPLAPSHESLALAVPRALEHLGEEIEDTLAHVVAGVPVLRSGIPEPHHRVGHAGPAPLLLLLRLLGPPGFLALFGGGFLFLRLALR